MKINAKRKLALLLCLALTSGLLPATALAAENDTAAETSAVDLRGTQNADGSETADGIPDSDEYFVTFDLGDGVFNGLHNIVVAVKKAKSDRETTRRDLITLAETIAAGIKNDAALFDGWDIDLSTLQLDGDTLIRARYKNRSTDTDDGSTTIPDEDTPTADTPAPALDRDDHYAYVNGYADGTVRPNANITRAEAATVFYRLLTDSSRKACFKQTNNFSDVDPDAWYNNAVSTLTNAGILGGYADGTFRPDGEITRAELTAMVMRFYDSGADAAATDAYTDLAGSWARQTVDRAAARGLVHGYADGTFRPNSAVTRAETVTILNSVLGRSPDRDRLLTDMKTWSDNADSSAWYYAAVQEATNSHSYTKGATDTCETWTAVTASPDWAALEAQWVKDAATA